MQLSVSHHFQPTKRMKSNVLLYGKVLLTNHKHNYSKTYSWIWFLGQTCTTLPCTGMSGPIWNNSKLDNLLDNHFVQLIHQSFLAIHTSCFSIIFLASGILISTCQDYLLLPGYYKAFAWIICIRIHFSISLIDKEYKKKKLDGVHCYGTHYYPAQCTASPTDAQTVDEFPKLWFRTSRLLWVRYHLACSPFTIRLIASHTNSWLSLTQHCPFGWIRFWLSTGRNPLYKIILHGQFLYLPRHQSPCWVRYRKDCPVCLCEVKLKVIPYKVSVCPLLITFESRRPQS